MHASLSAGLLCLVAGPSLWGQAQFNAPLSGVVFDSPSHSLRVISGVAGAAWFGPRLAEGLDAAFLAPNGRVAVGSRDGIGVLLTAGPDGWRQTRLGGLLTGVDRAAWAPDSSAVVVYSSRTASLQRLVFTATTDDSEDADAAVEDPVALRSSLPRDPASPARRRTPFHRTASYVVRDTFSLAGELGPLVVLPGTATILAGLRSGGEAGLYLFAAGRAPVPIAGIADPVAVAFDASQSALYVAERSGALFRVSHLDQNPYCEPLLTAVESLPEVAAIAPLPAGRILIAGGRQARIIDLTGHTTLQQFDLQVNASRLDRLASGSFALHERASATDSLWLLDPQGGRTVFVPATAQEK